MSPCKCQFLQRGYKKLAGEGVGVTSYIWHSMDVRAEWPPFSVLPGI